MLRYFLEAPSPLKRHILKFLLFVTGYPSQETTVAGDAHLLYGNLPASDSQILIPDEPTDLVRKNGLDLCSTRGGNALRFDIISATALLLTDQVNRRHPVFDDHQRLVFSSSYHAECGDATLPLVNVYAECLKSALTERFGPGIPLWPRGKAAAIGLSHDVDRFDRWAEVRGSLQTGRYAGIAMRSLVRNLARPHDDLQLFRELVDYEQGLGFKSTFMFAARNRFDPQASPYDLPYSLDQPTARAAIQYALDRNFEIGLHASYNAYQDAEMFREERRRLSDRSDREIRGLRHHFWHLGADVERTLAEHEKAGFTYDSSIAWNEQAGFRRGVALPYYPWHTAEQRPINVLQLPMCAMDGNFFYREHMTVQQAVQGLMETTGQVLRYGGLGVIDWHSDTAHPATPNYHAWGKAYFEFLHCLSQEPGLWVTSLGEIAAWVQKRESAIESSQITSVSCS